MAANILDIIFEILLGAGKVATSINNETEKRVEKVQNDYDKRVNSYERRYSNYSDQQLKEQYNNSSSSAEKRACVNLMNERKQNDKD